MLKQRVVGWDDSVFPSAHTSYFFVGFSLDLLFAYYCSMIIGGGMCYCDGMCIYDVAINVTTK
jgi:hypothetical protein